MMTLSRSLARSGARCGNRQAGVALAIVVWFIAGMSLLVAGIVAQARQDTHMAQVHVARAKAVAAGDGAIQLMMVDLMTAERGSEPAATGRYRVGEIEVDVILVPATGLIDINKASVEVLAALVSLAGQLSPEQAWLLADAVVQARSTGPAGGRQFDAIEDLLRVPGSSRALLDSVRDFIVVGESGQGMINWSLASGELLRVLATVSPAQADKISARRDNMGGRSRGSSGGQGAARVDTYRVDALVHYGDKTWLRRRWISLGANSSSALPWRVTRTEPARVLMENQFLLGRSVDA